MNVRTARIGFFLNRCGQDEDIRSRKFLLVRRSWPSGRTTWNSAPFLSGRASYNTHNALPCQGTVDLQKSLGYVNTWILCTGKFTLCFDISQYLLYVSAIVPSSNSSPLHPPIAQPRIRKLDKPFLIKQLSCSEAAYIPLSRLITIDLLNNS